MRKSIVPCALLLFGLVSLAAYGDDKPKDPSPLHGTWKAVKSEPMFEPTHLIFDGEKLTVVFGKEDKKETTYKLDASAKPAAIDIITDREKSLGIYEIDGDTLKLCFLKQKGDKRPTEFKAAPDVYLVTLSREKKE